MKKTVRLALATMLILGLAFSAFGCTKKTEQSDAQKAGETAKKVLLVATEATYPPFEYLDEKSNELVGFDMDLIRAIGKVQGYEVQIKSMGFDALIPAVQSGQADCAISAMSIKPERLAAADASEPYFNGGLIVAVQNDNTTIKSLDDLKGKKLAAEVGTIGLDASNDIKKQDAKTQVKVFDSVGEAFMELEKGGADAVINDALITQYYISKKGTKIKTVGQIFKADDQYVIYLKKGNTAIQTMLNDGLKKLKADGTYDKLKQQYTGDIK